MRLDFWQRLDRTARASTPGSVTALLILLMVTPPQLPHFGQISPALATIAIFYWAVHRPDLMPMWLVFSLGLLFDILAGAPMGLNALLYLLLFGIVLTQRRFFLTKPYYVMWWGYIIVFTMMELVRWTASSLIVFSVIPIEPAVFRTIITIGLFPLIYWLLVQVHRELVQTDG